MTAIELSSYFGLAAAKKKTATLVADSR